MGACTPYVYVCIFYVIGDVKKIHKFPPAIISTCTPAGHQPYGLCASAPASMLIATPEGGIYFYTDVIAKAKRHCSMGLEI